MIGTTRHCVAHLPTGKRWTLFERTRRVQRVQAALGHLIVMQARISLSLSNPGEVIQRLAFSRLMHPANSRAQALGLYKVALTQDPHRAALWEVCSHSSRRLCNACHRKLHLHTCHWALPRRRCTAFRPA